MLPLDRPTGADLWAKLKPKKKTKMAANLSSIAGVTVDVERRQQSHQLLVTAPAGTSASCWSLIIRSQAATNDHFMINLPFVSSSNQVFVIFIYSNAKLMITLNYSGFN